MLPLQFSTEFFTSHHVDLPNDKYLVDQSAGASGLIPSGWDLTTASPPGSPRAWRLSALAETAETPLPHPPSKVLRASESPTNLPLDSRQFMPEYM